MSTVELERSVKAKPATVWSVVSDLGQFAGTAPGVESVEVTGGEKTSLTRRCRDRGGNAWDERCTEWIDQHRCAVALSGDGFPLAVAGLTQRWRIEQRGDSVSIFLATDYTPSYGPVGRVLDALGLRDRLVEAGQGLLESWVKAIRDREWSYRVDVATILGRKGSTVTSVAPSDSVHSVARLLAAQKIGAVLVLDGDEQLVGIVSERDIVRCLAEHGADSLGRTVDTIMTRKLVVCAPDDDTVHVMACMTDRRVRHLPVMDGDRLAGMISIGDVVKARIGTLEAESETMRDYIAAREWRYH